MALDRRTVAVVVVLLVAAAGLGVGGGLVFGGRERTAGRAVELAATGSPAAPTPTDGAGVGGTPARTAPKIPAPLPTGPAVPVYVLGGTDGGSRLYREFRPGGPAAVADPVRAALAGLAEPPADPDYRTPWAGVAARAARWGASVTVTFAGAPRLRSPAEARSAVQQVVWTVTAADPSVAEVRVVAAGLPATLTAAAVRRADQAVTLAPVWVLDPVDGGRSGGRVTVSGTASVVEATVLVEVRRGSAVVARATATASAGAPARGTWAVAVSLPPGDYVVAAFEESAKDGSAVGTDTKRVTVR